MTAIEYSKVIHDILIVEDHAPSLRATTRLLERHGHTVRGAESVNSAIKAILARVPTHILLDMHLPDGSGLDVYNHSADICQHHAVLWIALTGDVSDTDRKRYSATGIHSLLKKPIDKAALMSVLG